MYLKLNAWLVALVTLLFATSKCYASPPVQQQPDFNLNWHFTLQDNPHFAQAKWPDAKWETVTLPHDWSIKSRLIEKLGKTTRVGPFFPDAINQYDTGYTQGGIGWYRKTLKLGEINRRAVLYFDGVYMNAQVFVNGEKLITHHYGYTPFSVDITDTLRANSDNVIAVRVNNEDKNSRWYSGSGIYRQAALYWLPADHLGVYKPHISSEITQQNHHQYANISVVSELAFHSENGTSTLTQQILDHSGKVVAEATPVNITRATPSVTTHFKIASPRLWSTKTPYLYQLRQTIENANGEQQVKITPVGIRTLAFSSSKGFLLNGESVLLRGMNIHHDNYQIGAEAYPAAEYRKLSIIKQQGYNAIRLSHNPPSTALLNAADQLGILVINEAFDAWNEHKWQNVNDYARYFADNWQQDLTAMIKRDQYHPSIIMWSMGNEIPEQFKPLGADTARQLVQFAKTLDTTRPITVGANISGESGDAYLNEFDVVGYNYQEHNYLNDHERFPQRIMYGSETYANKAAEYWQFVEQYPFIIGDFVWTGWDYIGEASIGWTGYAPEWAGLAPYPWHLAYCGEIDVLGQPRAAANYRKVLWQTEQNGLYVYVKSPAPSLLPQQDPDWYLMWVQRDLHPSWTWPNEENTPMTVEVYSRAPQVTLRLNGQSIATQTQQQATDFIFSFTVPYVPGELTVESANDRGEVLNRKQLVTSTKPRATTLTSNKLVLDNNGQDLAYVNIALVDEEGNPVYWWGDDKNLSLSISGAADIYAVGNGEPDSTSPFDVTTRRTFRGQAQVILRSIAGQSGEITLTVSGEGLTPSSITLEAR